jgi:alanine dehydrogenase
LNIHEGKITHRAVADALGPPHLPASEVLER